MEKWFKYLKSLGLTDSEAKVYLAVLKSGPQPVQKIAAEVGFSRVTVYEAIESLAGKSLMTSVEKGKKQYFAAEPPERILSLAENKMNAMKTAIAEMKSGLNELKLVQSGDKPIVKMFEGEEALMSVFQELVEGKSTEKIDELCEFANISAISRAYSLEQLDFLHKKILENKIKRRLIYLRELPRQERPLDPAKQVKYLKPSDTDPFYGDVIIYGNKVWLASFKGKHVTVVIDSEEIKNTFQAWFDLLWKKL